MAEVSSTVQRMVYDALHIVTALDGSTQRRISNEILDGIAYINKYIDAAATCEPGSEHAALLTSYVLYAEAGALDQFRANYAPDVLSGRLAVEAAAFAEVEYAESETEN